MMPEAAETFTRGDAGEGGLSSVSLPLTLITTFHSFSRITLYLIPPPSLESPALRGFLFTWLLNKSHPFAKKSHPFAKKIQWDAKKSHLSAKKIQWYAKKTHLS